jgi:hypothetical protein
VYCFELFTQSPHIDSLLLINYSLHIAYKYLQQSGIAIECVTLTDPILEVPASNLTPKTGYSQFFTAVLGPYNCLHALLSCSRQGPSAATPFLLYYSLFIETLPLL